MCHWVEAGPGGGADRGVLALEAPGLWLLRPSGEPSCAALRTAPRGTHLRRPDTEVSPAGFDAEALKVCAALCHPFDVTQGSVG